MKTKKILIIEDDMQIGNLEQEVLEQKGYDILRAYSGTEVLMLLDGAQDYLTKPLSTKELLARVEVQFRRSAAPLPDRYSSGDIVLDHVSHSVKLSGIPIALTKTEYAILKLLIQNPGQVIAKSVILDRISEDTQDCTESSLKTHISHLRTKLREVSGKEYIESVWGIGFKFSAD